PRRLPARAVRAPSRAVSPSRGRERSRLNAPFCLDCDWDFAVPPARFWNAISRTADYPAWWSWLRRIDATELREGAVARCLVRGPVPFDLRLEIAVHELEPERLVPTEVGGDL